MAGAARSFELIKSFRNIRILSIYFRNRTVNSPKRLFSYYHNSKIIPQLKNCKDNKNDDDTRKKTTFLLPMLFGFSLFGKSGAKDDEQKEEAPVKKDILEDEVVTVLKHAKLNEIKKEYPEAEKLYHRALGLINVYDQNSTWDKLRLLQARVYIYDSLANLALARGEIEKAEKLYKETLKGSLQQGMSKNHDAVVEISLKLAMIYAAQKKNMEAYEGYQFCIKAQEEKMKDMKEIDDNTAALLGMALDAFARFLMVQNRNDEAQDNLEKSLNIARKVFGNSHVQVAVLLNDIATVNSLKKDYDLARKNLEEAIKIAEDLNSPDLPTFYFNLGAIHERRGSPSEAGLAYSRALTLAKKIDDKVVQKKAKDALNSINKT